MSKKQDEQNRQIIKEIEIIHTAALGLSVKAKSKNLVCTDESKYDDMCYKIEEFLDIARGYMEGNPSDGFPPQHCLKLVKHRYEVAEKQFTKREIF